MPASNPLDPRYPSAEGKEGRFVYVYPVQEGTDRKFLR